MSTGLCLEIRRGLLLLIMFFTFGDLGKAGQFVKNLRPSYKVIIEGRAVYVQPEEGESVAR